MRSSKSLVALLPALAGLGGVSFSPAQARASQEFPGALQAAANMPCVPDCVVCHGVSPGTATTFANKKLGASLFMKGANQPHNTVLFNAAFKVFAADPANAASLAALARGDDPETGGNICTPTYGCAVTSARRSAQRSPPAFDVVAGGLALLTGLLLMRRRRS